MEAMDTIYDTIIVGSGPAGLTAAIYAARANLTVLLLAGWQHGGQLMLTSEVENYPGFPEGIMGPDLMEKWEEQARRFGTEILPEDVTSVDFAARPFRITAGESVYRGKTIIISTGASAKWLGIPSEERLRGRGVSGCATCDGFFFKNKAIAVVGGGDTALEEGLFLTRFASKVTIIHRRDQLRGSKIMQERAQRHPKIEFAWDSAVEEVLGNTAVSGVRLCYLKTGETRDLAIEGLLVAIGHQPNTALFQGQVEMDTAGYILHKEHTMTSVPGVFAAGDVVDHRYRQAVTAAGQGCAAAMDVERFLETEAASADPQTRSAPLPAAQTA